MKKKTYKQIEASRNRRLWITQVILPVAGFVVTVASNDNLRTSIVTQFGKVKNKLKDKFTN